MFEDLKVYGAGINSIISKQTGKIEIELSIQLSYCISIFKMYCFWDSNKYFRNNLQMHFKSCTEF